MTQTDEVHTLQDLSCGKNGWRAFVASLIAATVTKESLDHRGFSTALSIFVESMSEQLCLSPSGQMLLSELTTI